MRPTTRILLACLGVAALATAAHAQERYGAITGIVRDESGGVMAGASVVAVNTTTERATEATTDINGAYRLNDLEPGRYRVRFELPGFTSREMPDLAVPLGKTLELDATLTIGALDERIEVAAAAPPLVDMRTATVAHDVDAEEMELLPKSRSFQSLALTAPSVNTGVIEGGFQVNGASGAENAFTIDGVVTSSLYNGRSRQDAAFEYVQEVQIKTTGIPAEYGGAMGGVISAVTKSGGNTWRGDGHYYYDGSALGAAPPPRLVLSPTDDKTVTQVQDAKQPDHRTEIGGSLGGPIVRQRLFVFASASPRVIRRQYTYHYGDGAQAGDIAQQQTFMQAFGKVSYAGRRITGSLSVLTTPTTSTGTLPLYNGTRPNGISSSLAGNAPNVNRGFDTTETSTTGSLDVTLSPASFLSIRGSYFSDSYKDTGIPNTTSISYQTSSVGLSSVPPSLQGPIGTQNTPRALITAYDRTSRGEFAVEYNRTADAAGTHVIKAGAGVQHSLSDASAAYPGGYVLLYWNRAFSYAGTSGRGAYGYYEVDDRGFTGTAGADMASLFVQDEWRVRNRLTLDVGVRAETEKIPTYRPDLRQYVLDFGFGDKIAPRLGASLDLTGDGRAKIFGSWGRYYDWTKYELSRNALGSDFWRIYYRSLDTLDVSSLSLSNMPGRDLWIVPGSFRDQDVPGLDRVDPGTKSTYQDSASVGFERQIGAHAVATVHYVHNDLRQVIEDVGTVVNGNSVLMIINPGQGYGATMATTGLTAPFATPPVTRLYDALELAFVRRLSSNWLGSVSYTYSRLYGNYSGLANSDEIRTPTTGGSYLTPQAQDRSIANPGGALRTSWNIDELMWDAHGNLDVLGRLATDRPHVVKAYGAYTLPFGTQVGVLFYGASGTPISTYVVTTNQTEVFVNGRGDMGRTPVLTQTNLLVSHAVPLGARKLRVELNVTNVFDQKTVTHIFNYLNRGGGGVPRASSAIDLSRVNLATGYDYNALIRATPDGANAYDPRYGQPDLFADGIQARLMVKLYF